MGVRRDDRRMDDFQKVLWDYHLADLGFDGPWFTWERGNFEHNNIRERLDRGVQLRHGGKNPKFYCATFASFLF